MYCMTHDKLYHCEIETRSKQKRPALFHHSHSWLIHQSQFNKLTKKRVCLSLCYVACNGDVRRHPIADGRESDQQGEGRAGVRGRDRQRFRGEASKAETLGGRTSVGRQATISSLAMRKNPHSSVGLVVNKLSSPLP